MTLPIRLDTFLKLSGVAQTGGHAKMIIQGSEVTVDGEVETRRGRKLRGGESVAVGGQTLTVPDAG
ncbi:MAG: RNA-binding S4 domain-containing protein [Myxococcota bacterium]|nr:RNA-binding S4 domain-containing protein [Myxococcota bacterium]